MSRTGKKRDTRTLDMFMQQQRGEPVPRFDETVTAAATLGGRIYRAMKKTLDDLKESDGLFLDRQAIAERMSDYLGERVSLAMLNKYVSNTPGDHEISLVRFLAFIHATGDFRLLNLLVEPFGFICTPRENEGWIKAGKLLAEEEQIKAQLDATQLQRRVAMRMTQVK